MATTVKTGWLNDKNGDKFAPKTLTSQVQTSDGTLLEDKIQADLDAVKTEILSNVSIDVDDALSSTSTNPVQNKVINTELETISTTIDVLESAIDDKLDSTTASETYETITDAQTKYDEAIIHSNTNLETAKTYTEEYINNGKFISYGEQTLTAEEQAQARENIGASVPQVQADWEQSSTDSVDYIKNKPFGLTTSNKFTLTAINSTTFTSDLTVADISQFENQTFNVEIGENYATLPMTISGYESANEYWYRVIIGNDSGLTLKGDLSYASSHYYSLYVTNNPAEMPISAGDIWTCSASSVFERVVNQQLDDSYIPDTIARTTYVDENFALKSDLENIDLSAYETTENAQLKLDEAKSYTDTSLANYYTKTEIDNLELITVDDIDAICGTTILVASDEGVTF